MTPTERHARHAARFGEVVAGVDDWMSPTPVADWHAFDVLDHLIDWSVEFLAAGDVHVDRTPHREANRLAAWQDHSGQIQRLLEAPDAERDFTHPYLGTRPLDQTINDFYTTDVFMHTWDLARATGQDETLDPAECEELLAGMEPIDDVLRSSGQYGPRIEVANDASAQDRMIGFIGRDPNWRNDA